MYICIYIYILWLWLCSEKKKEAAQNENSERLDRFLFFFHQRIHAHVVIQILNEFMRMLLPAVKIITVSSFEFMFIYKQAHRSMKSRTVRETLAESRWSAICRLLSCLPFFGEKNFQSTSLKSVAGTELNQKSFTALGVWERFSLSLPPPSTYSEKLFFTLITAIFLNNRTNYTFGNL